MDWWLIILIIVVIIVLIWWWLRRPKNEPPNTTVAPMVEAPKNVIPAPENIKRATPAVETPKRAIPVVEIPKSVTPAVEAPQSALPAVEIPKSVTPAVEAPKSAAPVVKKTDNFTIIEGIGPKVSSLLNAAGISSFEDLASTDVAKLAEILKAAHLRMMAPDSWPKQAKLAAEGKMDELKALQDTLKGGR